jgi:hypothetical protein
MNEWMNERISEWMNDDNLDWILVNKVNSVSWFVYSKLENDDWLERDKEKEKERKKEKSREIIIRQKEIFDIDIKTRYRYRYNWINNSMNYIYRNVLPKMF